METLKIVFWTCFVLVIYTYLGYGGILYLILKIKGLFIRKEQTPILPIDEQLLPEVTLMICAYNEQYIIREKMKNIHFQIIPLNLMIPIINLKIYIKDK